ncbi:MAG: hypothetical protein AB1540_03355 [Bdellovibrionota bacterium]
MHLRVIFICWVLVCLCAFSAVAESADALKQHSLAAKAAEPEPVTIIDTVPWSEAIVDQRLEEIRAFGLEVTEITFYRKGEIFPEELELWMRWKHNAGISVRFETVSDAQFDRLVQEQAELYANEAPLFHERLQFQRPRGASIPYDAHTLREHFRNAGAVLRDLLRLSNGVNWTKFKVERSRGMKTAELATAFAKAAFLAKVTEQTLKTKIAEGKIINWEAPALFGALISIGFDYWQQGNSRFKGQGRSYNLETKQFEKGIFFHLLTSYSQSIFTRQLLGYVAFVFAGVYVPPMGDMIHALGTSTLGLQSRFPFEFQIEKARKRWEGEKWGQWKSFASFALLALVFNSLSVIDQFQHGTPALHMDALQLKLWSFAFELGPIDLTWGNLARLTVAGAGAWGAAKLYNVTSARRKILKERAQAKREKRRGPKECEALMTMKFKSNVTKQGETGLGGKQGAIYLYEGPGAPKNVIQPSTN